jgi:hypothetical protein
LAGSSATRGGPSSIQRYSDEYPLFLAKYFMYSSSMNYSRTMHLLLIHMGLLRSHYGPANTERSMGFCN